ncbi:SRPBCC family protein [Mesonia maritima]|uniref:SRPBCC family protein n=1 Tax=Mesonia maritima TaxID=1793873 RepID=UPI003634E1C5
MNKLEKQKVVELKKNHWQTYTSILINAPLEELWNTLTDWDNISNWSSTLKNIEGERFNNGKVVVSYSVNGNIYETNHNFIYIENIEFGWSDPMEGTFGGLTDNHRFKVERISDNQTLFVQMYDFKGEGDEISAKEVANQTVKFFPTFNQELKKEVENKTSYNKK